MENRVLKFVDRICRYHVGLSYEELGGNIENIKKAVEGIDEDDLDDRISNLSKLIIIELLQGKKEYEKFLDKII